MRCHHVLGLGLLLIQIPTTHAQAAHERVPGDRWLRFEDPAEAGFDAAGLDAAREAWAALPSSAFMVVAGGAVVAAWGDVDRRYMCHSVRKSFLSALYGIYWDRGALELNKTLADLGLDDEPDPLLETEKMARILDLLKARSGVFHPAAYAGRTDSRPRGSEGPGRFFAYNNWDFNTLAAILEMETGASVFAAFDEFFGRPLDMEDWRVSDGYFHYEPDKSKYPAYPFRMSARDAARFGLLFARCGTWGDERILSRHWVRRSTALYSIDTDVMGYGYMWWVFREPRFERHGMVAALGVGNQMIAALPDSDLVIVNRANTYEDEGTPMGPLLDLIASILDARTGSLAADPRLVPLETTPDPRLTRVSDDSLREFVGTWAFPPPALGVPAQSEVHVRAEDGHLVAYEAHTGTFGLYVQPDGSFHEEDSLLDYLPVRDDQGAFDGVCEAERIVSLAMRAVDTGDVERARALFACVPGDEVLELQVGRGVLELLTGDPDEAEGTLVGLASDDPAGVERHIASVGSGFLEGKNTVLALALFELETRLFPQAFQAWNRLAEAQRSFGDDDGARISCEQSLELEPENEVAERMLAQLE